MKEKYTQEKKRLNKANTTGTMPLKSYTVYAPDKMQHIRELDQEQYLFAMEQMKRTKDTRHI